MSDDAGVRPNRIIKRTLTVTTVETWTITLSWSDTELPREDGRAAQDIIDQTIDPISQDNQEEQP